MLFSRNNKDLFAKLMTAYSVFSHRVAFSFSQSKEVFFFYFQAVDFRQEIRMSPLGALMRLRGRRGNNVVRLSEMFWRGMAGDAGAAAAGEPPRRCEDIFFQAANL
jgi:hypothetical protein